MTTTHLPLQIYRDDNKYDRDDDEAKKVFQDRSKFDLIKFKRSS